VLVEFYRQRIELRIFVQTGHEKQGYYVGEAV
jgi:hypothetical protein